MKNLKLLLGMIFLTAVQTAFASDSALYDTLIKNALDKLVEGRKTPIELTLSPVTIGDSESVAELGAYLDELIKLYASNNKLYKIAASDAANRGITVGEVKKATLGGSYTISGGAVNVTLRLAGGAENGTTATIASTSFKIPLAELKNASLAAFPANITNVAAASAKDTMMRNLASTHVSSSPVSGSGSGGGDFSLSLWGADTRIFYEGDTLSLNLISSADSYFKIYLIDVENNVRMLYPNSIDSDNRLRANVRRRIPEKSEFTLGAPYGEETIIAVASRTQFPNIEEQMPEIKLNKSTSNAVSSAMDLSQDTVSAIYKYTILKKSVIKETYSYTKPDNFSEYLDSLRAEAKATGGKFSGDENEGTFTKKDASGEQLTGTYKTSGNKINVTMFLDSAMVNTRGVSTYAFSFPKPPDLVDALSKVKNEIEKNNGNFSGNESEGSFTASGIAGNYSVVDHVNVSIFKKPAIVPNSLIEKEIKKYFGVK
jgi:hypothetical protein